MKKLFEEAFSQVKDPRSARNQIYSLTSLIGTTFCAVLSGIDSFNGIAEFVEFHLEELKQYFDFSDGAPSHDTYQRLWNMIDPVQFQSSFQTFVESLHKISGEVLSIDGKTIRNSGKLRPLHILSAWCSENGMVLGQLKMQAKSNEITAIPELLKQLDLRNKTVTIDAMGCTKNICKQIIDRGGDYVIALKKNHLSLLEDVEPFLQNMDFCLTKDQQNDKGHGRIEQRIATVSHEVGWIQQKHQWPGLKAIGCIVSKVLRKDKETKQTRFFIASKALDAAALNDIVRKHWSIENQLHWVLDVSYNEDKGCIRNENAAENINIIRKWAMIVLKKSKINQYQSIKSVMRRNIMSFSHLVESVKNIFHA